MKSNLLISISGVSVMTIGVISMVGYLIRIEGLYQWATTPMAINTAVCITLIGLALILTGLKKKA